jgi:cell wall-associated NlpC family hydrolase
VTRRLFEEKLLDMILPLLLKEHDIGEIMGKVAWMVYLCSSFFLLTLCCPALAAAKQAASAVRTVRKSHKHHASTNKLAGLRAARRSRVNSADRQSGRTKRMKTAKLGEAATREGAVHVTGTDKVTVREKEENSEYIEYRVKRGDTVEKLARLFRFARDEFTDLNGVKGKRLKPGTTVFIPKTEEDGEDAPIALNNRPLRPWKSEDERGMLVKVAKSFAGAPYRYGGNSVRGLDCSAFVKKMYEIFEVQLPRSAREQFCAGPRVSKDDLVTGDLVFFKTKSFAHYPTHVGIYIGDNCFIHASSLFGRGVNIDRLSDAYFARTFVGAVRVKGPPPAADKTDTDQEQRTASNNNTR